ncbi:MAG: hypothetical protein ACPGWR_00595 [Ardenticatenaceae bacterium]
MRRLSAVQLFIFYHFRRDVLLSIFIVLLSLALSIAFNLQTIHSYAINNDNFALMLYSAVYFDPTVVDWFINGFRSYFLVYPEVFRDAQYFIRPTQNILIYLISLFAETPNSVAFLVVYYLVHSLCCGLVYLYSRFFGCLSKKISLFVALLFWGTMASERLYVLSPAFGGDALGALLGMGALLLTYAYLNHSTRYKQPIFALIITLLLLAVYTKEAFITAPVIVAIYWLWEKLRQANQVVSINNLMTIVRRDWLPLIALLSISVLYLLHITMLRIIFDTGAAVYPLQRPVSLFFKTPIYTLLSYFFPVEQRNVGVFMRSLLDKQSLSLALLLRTSLAILFNLVSLTLILFLFVKDRVVNRTFDNRLSLLILLAIISMMVPFFLGAEQRFMYFGQMFSIPLLIVVIAPYFESDRVYARCLVLVACIIFMFLNPIYLFASKLPMQRSEFLTIHKNSIHLQTNLLNELHDPQLRRVYLLNDTTGYYSALAQLHLITAQSTRDDLQLRVINSIIGFDPSPSANTTEGVEFAIKEDHLCITTSIEEETFHFAGGGLTALDRLGIPGLIDYEFEKEMKSTSEEIKRFTACIPDVTQNDILLIGFDPSKPGMHIWRSTQPTWQPVNKSSQ